MSHASDEKKLSGVLKKLGTQTIPGIEEVNLFTSDSNIIHFASPKVSSRVSFTTCKLPIFCLVSQQINLYIAPQVQANVQAHTFVVSGNAVTKPVEFFLPGILSQLSPEGVEKLRKAAQQRETDLGDAEVSNLIGFVI